MNEKNQTGARNGSAREPEYEGSAWKNPYILYILLTIALFLFLVVMGWIAWTHGWIPNRGISE